MEWIYEIVLRFITNLRCIILGKGQSHNVFYVFFIYFLLFFNPIHYSTKIHYYSTFYSSFISYYQLWNWTIIGQLIDILFTNISRSTLHSLCNMHEGDTVPSRMLVLFWHSNFSQTRSLNSTTYNLFGPVSLILD